MTPSTAACQASLFLTVSQNLLKLMSTESAMLSNQLTPPPSSFSDFDLFQHEGLLSDESALCIRWPKNGSSPSPSVLPINIQGWFPSMIDWFDLLAVQGTPKSLLQDHNLKASILQCSPFLMVQLSHLYRTTGKTRHVMIQMFVSKVMSLLFNMLSRFVIAFLPRSKYLLNS